MVLMWQKLGRNKRGIRETVENTLIQIGNN